MDHLKQTLDMASLGTALATFTSLLPPLAALLSIVWTGIRIYEWAVSRRQADD